MGMSDQSALPLGHFPAAGAASFSSELLPSLSSSEPAETPETTTIATTNARISDRLVQRSISDREHDLQL